MVKIIGGWGKAFENLVVIPDYQGYGASSDRIHPYLYQSLSARQVVDGVLAAIEYYQESHKFEKNWKTIAMGYSQGGSVAMAVHKYIEENNLASPKSNWKPKQRLVLVHSKNNEVVPFDNYVSVRDAFLGNSSFSGYPYIGTKKNLHVHFGKVFYLCYTDEGSRDLFSGSYKNKETELSYWNSFVSGL